MHKAMKVLAGVLSLAVLATGGFVLGLSAVMPDHYFVAQGESLVIKSDLGIKALGFSQEMPKEIYSRAGNNYKLRLTLPYGPVIKAVDVQVVSRDMVIPGGRPFGIKMFTEGVMVVGMSDLEHNGKPFNPAKAAGLKTGDIILEIDGKKITRNEQVGEIIADSKGAVVDVVYTRGGERTKTVLTPATSDGGGYRAGMWVRDSSAGIGTMTYYNPTTGVFAGLGHAICDVDTGNLMPLASGEAVDVTITGVNRGTSGFPGELKGMFTGAKMIGSLYLNSDTGIYGVAEQSPMAAEPIELATRSEVRTGPAFIYATVDGRETQAYSIMIERIASGDTNPTKNMVVHVTDKRLLDITGGIVQGMSGSPIIQNNRLVGAVTHVFVNDPARGYAIFAENMEREAQRANLKRDMAA